MYVTKGASLDPYATLDRFYAYKDAIEAALGEVLTPYGLTISQWRVLKHAAENDRVAPSALAQALRLDRPHVSRLETGLIDQGLMVRVPSRLDRRSHDLLVTPKGREIYDMSTPLCTAALAATFKVLSNARV